LVGAFYDHALISFQIIFSVCVSALLFKHVWLVFFESTSLIILACVCETLSQSCIYDQIILSDSLNASVLKLAFLILAVAIGRDQAIGKSKSFFYGMYLSIAILIRSITVYLSLIYVPLIPAWNFFAKRETLRASLTGMAMAILPILICTMTYMRWNYYRAGHYFISTGGQQIIIHALLDASQQGVPVFNGASQWDQVGRETLAQENVIKHAWFNHTLHDQYGWTSVEITNENFKRYKIMWFKHPMGMFRTFLSHFNFECLRIQFMPMENIMFLWQCPTNKSLSGMSRILRLWREGKAVFFEKILFFIYGFEHVVALILFLLFLFSPFLVSRGSLRFGVSLLWILVVSFYSAHGMLHMETRYPLPVVAPMILCSLLSIQCLKRRLNL
jgi:hypothetical protein